MAAENYINFDYLDFDTFQQTEIVIKTFPDSNMHRVSEIYIKTIYFETGRKLKCIF